QENARLTRRRPLGKTGKPGVKFSRARSMDQSKKTMRHFYCRDVLWETFEQMANDFDCSIDYLINEAMRYYARSKNYHAQATASDLRSGTGPGVPGTNPPPSPARYSSQPSATQRRPPPPPSRPTAAVPTQSYAAQSMTPSGGMPAAPRRAPAGTPRSTPPSADAVPIPASPPGHVSASAAAFGQTLVLVFNSQRIPIEKDQFIIGR